MLELQDSYLCCEPQLLPQEKRLHYSVGTIIKNYSLFFFFLGFLYLYIYIYSKPNNNFKDIIPKIIMQELRSLRPSTYLTCLYTSCVINGAQEISTQITNNLGFKLNPITRPLLNQVIQPLVFMKPGFNLLILQSFVTKDS